MPDSLHENREALSEAVPDAIAHLYGCGYSYKDIGLYMGYPESTAKNHVSQFRNEGRTPPGFEIMRLSQLASREGFDDLADLFSAPAKCTVASTAGEAEANLCILEENEQIAINVGHAIAAFNAGKARVSRQCIARVIGACFDFQKEIEAYQVMISSRGGGAPTLMPNRALSSI